MLREGKGITSCQQVRLTPHREGDGFWLKELACLYCMNLSCSFYTAHCGTTDIPQYSSYIPQYSNHQSDNVYTDRHKHTRVAL